MKKYIYTLILLFVFAETLFAGNILYSTFDLLQDPRITDVEAKVNDLNETKINTINDSIALVADSAVELEQTINNLSDTVAELSDDVDTLSASLGQYIKKTDNIYSDSILSIVFEKINGDTVTKNYVDTELAKKLNISDSIVRTKISELQNDSNFISYNDSLYFTLLNPTSLVADTNIINDTLLFNDTACWVIYGDSYNVDLNNYTYNYEVFFDTGLASGTWGKSELFIYRDKTRNLIAFKSAVYNFAEGNIEITFLRRR
jgi:uncharacterized coiled-coil protein SlyX